jgi:regulator of protease activity HflC (stomatin/prohibitin superfamily)
MFTILAIVLLVIYLSASAKVVRESERVVVFRFGRFFMVKGPGLVLVIPIVERMVRVNLNKEIPEWQTLSRMELNQKVKALVLNERIR